MAETVFTYAAPGLKFGRGASVEIGFDLHQLIGASAARPRVLLVTDAGVAATGHPARIAAQIVERGLEVTTFERARVEPTDESLEEAIAFARTGGPWDAIVAVGGGSAIDTAKAVNLLVTNEGELFDYLNAPVGAGRAPAQPLLPLVAVPTTTGTGSVWATHCGRDGHPPEVKNRLTPPPQPPPLA
ncbi:iron-containing alcohol dehydrogenase, partial [Nocardioides sp.]|uniref:iron-containing alcohol dehydrogenase n=1 Tax=Nocardioides sp. TaxID=35761 RepID=UPI00286DB787